MMRESSISFTKGKMETMFIADNNGGMLARWLRMIGYDVVLFKRRNNSQIINITLREHRVILSKYNQLMKRRLVSDSRVRAMIIKQNDPTAQLKETVKRLYLNYLFNPFSLCLECNQVFVSRSKD